MEAVHFSYDENMDEFINEEIRFLQQLSLYLHLQHSTYDIGISVTLCE